MRCEVSFVHAQLAPPPIPYSHLYAENAGTEEENKSVAQTVINTAADRSKTMAFNYASLALNNSFFLDMLVTLPVLSSPMTLTP